MTAMPSDPELYLEHSGFVRTLARAIVLDEHLAADIEQQTWLAALEHAPREPSSARAWLRSLVRNFAIKSWRGAARRAERETLFAREGRVVSQPQEIVEREQVRRRVVEALLALDEPYRRVLTLRFYDELEPHEIAALLRIPVETVRTRIRRGLERLRERLRRDGGWSAFLACGFDLDRASRVAPAPHVSAPLLRGALLMSSTHKALAGLAVLLLVLCAIYFSGASRGIAPVVESRSEASASDVRLAAQTATTAHVERESIPDDVHQLPPRVEDTDDVAAAFGSIDLRVLWIDRTPAAGVALYVASTGDDEQIVRSLRVRTDEHGRVELSRLAAGRIQIEPDRGGEAAVELAPGEHRELELVLPRGVDLDGRVVDEQGAPVADARVMLWYGRRRPHEEDEVARTDAEGRFAVRSVDLEYSACLSARAEGHAPTRRKYLLSSSGVQRSLVLVFEGEGFELVGEVADESGSPVVGASVLVGPESWDEARGEPDGSTSVAAPGELAFTDDHGRFRIGGVAGPQVELRVRARGFAPWSGASVVPTSRPLRIELHRGARVHGIARDEHGIVLERAFVHTGAEFGFGDVIATSGSDGSYELSDVPTGEVEVFAAHEQAGRARTKLVTTSAGNYEWNCVLSHGVELRGRLVLDGSSFEAWKVGLMPYGVHDESAPRFEAADAEGRFRFEDCLDLEYRVFACPPCTALVAVASVDHVRPGPGEVVLRLSRADLPSSHIVGRVVGSAGHGISGAVVSPHTERALGCEVTISDVDGRFDIGPLPPGAWSLSVMAPGSVEQRVAARELAPEETWTVGDVILLEAGSVSVTLTGEPDLVAGAGAPQIFALEREWFARLEPAADRWRLGSLPPGRYGVAVVGSAEIALAPLYVDVRAGEETTLELPLRRGFARKWSYSDESGAAPRVHLALTIVDGDGVILGRTRAIPSHGELVAEQGFLAGSYRVRAFEASGLVGELALNVEGSSDELPLRVILRR